MEYVFQIGIRLNQNKESFSKSTLFHLLQIPFVLSSLDNKDLLLLSVLQIHTANEITVLEITYAY